MKRTAFYRFLLILIVFGLALSSTQILPVFAQETTETPGTEITFAELGMNMPQSLPGPVSEMVLRFNFPVDWKIMPESVNLVINLSASFSTLMPAENQETITGLTGGDLDVFLNGTPILIKTLQESGEITLEVMFDPALLKSITRGEANELILRWNGSTACQMNLLSNIMVLPTSKLILTRELTQPTFDLNDFPAPFIIQDAIQPAGLTMILPTDATLSEVQAALITSAGLGRLSAGKQPIQTVTLDQYKPNSKGLENVMVFVEASRLEMSGAADLGTPDALEVQPGEGSIQIFETKTNGFGLLISGDAEGMIKAAQVLSTGQVMAAGDGTAMLVNAVHSLPQTTGIEEITLQDLGAGELVFSPTSGLTHSFDFYLPAGEEARPDSSFDLVLSHSQQLDYLRSGLTMLLNGYPTVSLRLNDQTSNEVLFRLILPTNLIHPGRNTIQFVANLNTRDICSQAVESTAWLKVSASSILHLPLERATSTALSFKKFSDFPNIFLSGNDLDNVKFILSLSDPESWPAAGELAYQLGSVLPDQNPVQLSLAAAENLDPASLDGYNLVLIGKPQNLALLSSQDQFPSMVFDDQNLLSEESSLTMVTTPTEAGEIGYTAIRGYPGAAHRVSLAVLGNTAAGLTFAVQSLKNPEIGEHNFAASIGEGVQASWFDESLAKGNTLQTNPDEPAFVGESDAPLQFRKGLMTWGVPGMIALAVLMGLLAMIEFRKNSLKK